MNRATDYRLCLSPLSNTIYISKVSKRDGTMTDDRYAVDKSEFIGTVIQWIENQVQTNGIVLLKNGKPFIKCILVKQEQSNDKG